MQPDFLINAHLAGSQGQTNKGLMKVPAMLSNNAQKSSPRRMRAQTWPDDTPILTSPAKKQKAGNASPDINQLSLSNSSRHAC